MSFYVFFILTESSRADALFCFKLFKMPLLRPQARPAAWTPPPRPPDARALVRRVQADGRGEGPGGEEKKETPPRADATPPGQEQPRPSPAASLAARAARLRRLKSRIDADLAKTLLDGQALPRKERRAVEEAAAGGAVPRPPPRGAAAPAAAALAPSGGVPAPEAEAAGVAALLQAFESHAGPGWPVADPREAACGGPRESAAQLRARLDTSAARAGAAAASPRAGDPPPPPEWRRRLKRASAAASAAGLTELTGVRPAPHAPPAVEDAAAAAHRCLLLLRRGLLGGAAGHFLDPLADAGFLGGEAAAGGVGGGAPPLPWSDELAAGVGAGAWRALWRGLGARGARTEGSAAWLRCGPASPAGITGPADPLPSFTVVADFFLLVPSPAWLLAKPGGAWRRGLGGGGGAEGEGGGAGDDDSTAPPPPPPALTPPVSHRVAAWVADPAGPPPAWEGRVAAAAAAAVESAPGLARARAAVAAARAAAAGGGAAPPLAPRRSGMVVKYTARVFPGGVTPPPPPGWGVAASVAGWQARTQKKKKEGVAATGPPPHLLSALALAPPTVLTARPASPTLVDVAVSGGMDGRTACLRRVVVWPPPPSKRESGGGAAAAPPTRTAAAFRRTAPTVHVPAFDALAALTPAGLKPKGPGPVEQKQAKKKREAAQQPLPPPPSPGAPPPAFDATPRDQRGGAWRDGSCIAVGVTLELTLEEAQGSGGGPPLRVAKAVSRWAGALVADAHGAALTAGRDVGAVVAGCAGFDEADWPLGPRAWPRRAAGAGMDALADGGEGEDGRAEVEEL